jgi:hypothetical protein
MREAGTDAGFSSDLHSFPARFTLVQRRPPTQSPLGGSNNTHLPLGSHYGVQVALHSCFSFPVLGLQAHTTESDRKRVWVWSRVALPSPKRTSSRAPQRQQTPGMLRTPCVKWRSLRSTCSPPPNGLYGPGRQADAWEGLLYHTVWGTVTRKSLRM